MLTPEERRRIQIARVLRKLQKKRVRVNGKRVCPVPSSHPEGSAVPVEQDMDY